MQCSDSFCAYGSEGTGYICLNVAPDQGLDTSVSAVNRINKEAKKFATSSNADIKAMAEALVNLTVKEARIIADKQKKGTTMKAMARPLSKKMVTQ